MSRTCRLISNTNQAMFRAPITTTASNGIVRSAGLNTRVATNARALGSLSSGAAVNGGETRSRFQSQSELHSPATLPQQLLHQSPRRRHHSHSLRSPDAVRNRFGTTNNNNNNNHTNNNTLHRRSMVTITQTKSSDLSPLFSSTVVDDVSASSQSPSAPTYVVNENTTLIVTESCLKQVERLLKQRRVKAEQPDLFDDGYFLRVFVDAGGCSGFQYQFEVDNELDDDEDVVVVMVKQQLGGENDDEAMRPRVVVDETSMGFLEGSTIDYVIEMIKSAFVVADNPQSESACGCGSSFAMKNFEKFGTKD